MRRFSLRLAFVALCAHVLVLAIALIPRAAFAAGSKSIAVLIDGADADALTAEIQSVLPPQLGVVDAKTFADALRKAGHSGPLGNVLAVKGALRDKLLGRARTAMETTSASAAILGRVRIGKLGKEVWLVWLSDDGDVRVDQAVSLRGDGSERRTALHAALDTPAEALVPPPATTPTTGPSSTEGPDKPDAPPEPEKTDPKSPRPPHVLATSLFSLAAAFELGGRHVVFSDPITQNIRPYDVLGVPMIAVAGEVYPAASSGIPVLKNIGLTARASFALGLSSSTKGGAEAISNTFLRFRGGLKWRFVPGTDKGPILALTGDFGMDVFSFDDAGDLADEVPSVEYQYLRAGGELRVPIGPLAFELGGGYRGLLGVGAMGERFTSPSALAFDGFVGFAVPLPSGFELRLSGDYTRVFYSFAPVPGDGYVAGGAVDEMLGARLGVAYVY